MSDPGVKAAGDLPGPAIFADDRHSAFMQYREVLIVGGIGEGTLRQCSRILDHGWLPRFLIREGEEGRIPGEVRSACRVTLGDALNRESAEMAAQGTSAIVFVPGPDTETNARIIRNLEAAASVWRIRLEIL